jgi:flagellar biosynthesis/type III secretory pathway protein FliH
LLANAPKEKSLTSADSCALYYFPELSGSGDRSDTEDASDGSFISRTPSRDSVESSPDAELEASAQVQAQIEAAFNKGLEQGRVEAASARQEKIERAADALKTAVDALTHIRQQDLARMQTETVRLAMAVARKIIGSQAEQGGVVERVVKAAMDKVSDPRQLTVKLNPDDMDTIDDCKRQLFPADDDSAVMRLEADPAIERGGCIIETILGDVDARIGQQIRIIEELLSAQLPKPSGDG